MGKLTYHMHDVLAIIITPFHKRFVRFGVFFPISARILEVWLERVFLRIQLALDICDVRKTLITPRVFIRVAPCTHLFHLLLFLLSSVEVKLHSLHKGRKTSRLSRVSWRALCLSANRLQVDKRMKTCQIPCRCMGSVPALV